MNAQAILEQLPDAVIVSDRDGVIRFWNAAAAQLLGYPAEEAIGQSLDLIIPERLRQRHWSGYRKTMETGESRYSEGDVLSVPALRKDGTTISIEFTILALKDEAGEAIGMGAIIRDVTKRFNELRALKQRLSETERTSTKEP